MERMAAEVAGFLRREGQGLVNGNGHEVILRGVGLGGWLLPEGYMWRLPDQVDRPRRIEQLVRYLIGKEKAERFWHAYSESYMTEADIRQIAHDGFNSVRLPINARTLLDKEGDDVQFVEHTILLIDRLVRWCRAYGLYVILDLHGAPGGQVGANIDDSESDIPELFTSENNRLLTVQLWRMLAERYRDEWIVAGYDLLNEPLPQSFSQYHGEVMPLYREIVQAIREVDTRHMIILEGVHWATDWSIFTELIDENVMLQFHKYWNNPDSESISEYLDMRVRWNVPIFAGEVGENNRDWYAGAFCLFEDHHISWNFWPWKKMDTGNSICSINMPAGWRLLTEHLDGGVTPSADVSERILWEYLANTSSDACVHHPEIVGALFRRPPVRIPSIFYGYRGEGVSFGVVNRTSENVGFRVHDGTCIRFVNGSSTQANFHHSRGEEWGAADRLCIHMAVGDWFTYEVGVAGASQHVAYICTIRAAALNEAGHVVVSVDNTTIGVVEISSDSWVTALLESEFRMGPGLHRIVLTAEKRPVRVEWLEIAPSPHTGCQ